MLFHLSKLPSAAWAAVSSCQCPFLWPLQAYFCQPALSAVCQGPKKKYPPITGQQMAESRYMDLDWLNEHEAKPAASKGTADHKAFKPVAVA